MNLAREYNQSPLDLGHEKIAAGAAVVVSGEGH